MKIERNHWLYLVFGVLAILVAWILFLSREILSPFIFAGIFAYILNPVISFLSRKAHLPRSAAILIVYILIVGLIAVLGVYVGRQIVTETRDFTHEARLILFDIESGQTEFPSWLAPYTPEISQAVRNSINISSQQVIRLFSGAVSSLLNIFIFGVALFYFLKEGEGLISYLHNLLPKDKKNEVAAALEKINRVLANYLLAQLSLVLFMATIASLVFTLMGMKYALILGVIVGFAELVPVVGPTIAFVTVVFVSTIGGGARSLDLPIYYEPVLIGLVYVLINQLENILIVPQVTGRMVRLHPLLILASVLIGGHLFGALGFLVAVPLVATVKVVVEHVLRVK